MTFRWPASVLAAVTMALLHVAAGSAGAQARGVWRSLGPNDFGGPVTAISIDPRNRNLIMIGTAGGGIWRSLNAGASWNAVNDLLPSLFISSLARRPDNPDWLYAGTGVTTGSDLLTGGAGIQGGAGILKSTDNGATWTVIPETRSGSLARVSVLSVAPSGGAILAATWEGLFLSTTHGSTWSTPGHSAMFVGVRFADVRFHPSDPLRALGALGDLGVGYFARSADGGQTWVDLPLPAAARRVAWSSADPSVVYAMSQRALLKSTDGGATFTQIATFDIAPPDVSQTIVTFVYSSIPQDIQAIWVDPIDHRNVVVGGLNLWRSVDGGTTFTRISDATNPQSAHGLIRTIVHDPGYNGTTNARVYVGTEGGLYKTEDILAASATSTTSWVPLNQGLAAMAIMSAAGQATTGDMVAVTQNNEILHYSGATGAWTRRYTPPEGPRDPDYHSNGQLAAFDPADPSYAYAADLRLRILRSSDGARTFTSIANGPFPAQCSRGGFWMYCTDSNAPFTLDPNNPSVILAADAHELYRTPNAKAATPEWVPQFPFGPRKGGSGAATQAVTPGNPDELWYVEGGSLYKSSNGSWLHLGSTYAGSFPGASRLVFDPRDTKTMYAPFAAKYGQMTRLSRSRDGGVTWSTLAIPASAGNVRDLAIDPADSNHLFLATDTGVFESADGAQRWTRNSPAVVRVEELFWMGSRLVAATRGRGVFVHEQVTGSVSIRPATVVFGATKLAASTELASVSAAQRVTVTFTGSSPGWVASADEPWLLLTNGSGTGTGAFTVEIVNPNDVIGGSTRLTATITVSAPGAAVAMSVPVTLNVLPDPSVSAPPFGSFDTPIGGTAVQGSIAVTGWALDDIEVDRVEIWRDLVAGETTLPFNGPAHPGHGRVFVAKALFVAGARPDVETAVPDHPFTYRAGWGYLLLTQGLWNQGNGPFTLYAFAFDKGGKVSTLGTKTITVGNATATKPFGALDTPTYGEAITGSFWNYGWALTPGANVVDGRTCTITSGNVLVAIDSGPLIAVTYGGARTDIPMFFPGFSNANNAGGAYYVDISTLANGTHSIGWFVVDNCGRVDGVGSRFFTVLKGSSVTAADASVRGVRLPLDSLALARGRQPDPVGVGLVSVRRTIGEWTEVPPNAAGLYVVGVGQSERVEVQLPDSSGASYSGAQVVNGERRALPLGSSLDAEAGIFYWQPAAGFLGNFELEFSNPSYLATAWNLVNAPNLVIAPNPVNAPNLVNAPNPVIRVRIVVGPPIRMAIDTPQAGGTADSPLVIGGWAVDLAAADGSGIDTVHVWAYPAAGGEPIFLGVASVGDARPDVAAIYGPQFERSSYSLAAPPLAPGTYDIVVYPHRAATGGFEAAQVVRLTVP